MPAAWSKPPASGQAVRPGSVSACSTPSLASTGRRPSTSAVFAPLAMTCRQPFSVASFGAPAPRSTEYLDRPTDQEEAGGAAKRAE